MSIIAILLMTTAVLVLLLGPKLYVLFWVKGGRESSSTHGTATGGGTGGSDFATDFKPDEAEF